MGRTIFNFMVAGALLGVIGTTLLYPRYKAWDNTPSSGKALCDCAEVTRMTAAGMANAQMLGCGGGAVAGLLLGIPAAMSGRRKRKEAQAALAAKAAATAAGLATGTGGSTEARKPGA